MTKERITEIQKHREAVKNLARIHRGMAGEILQHQDRILKRPGMRLLGSIYDEQCGAVWAYYYYGKPYPLSSRGLYYFPETRTGSRIYSD